MGTKVIPRYGVGQTIRVLEHPFKNEMSVTIYDYQRMNTRTYKLDILFWAIIWEKKCRIFNPFSEKLSFKNFLK